VTVSAAFPDAFGAGATPLSHAVRAAARRRARMVRVRMRERAVTGIAVRIGRLSPVPATEEADSSPDRGIRVAPPIEGSVCSARGLRRLLRQRQATAFSA
jgi:hypothetical protein